MKSIKNILVATDFSPDSQAALDEAVALALELKSTVYLVHNVDEVDACAADYCISNEQAEGAKNGLLSEARRKLNGEIQRFGDMKGVSIVPDLRYGRTYEEILGEEKEKDIDLLVIGPHPERTFWQRIASHLSEKLVRDSLCDTLVVRHAM